MLDDDTLKHLAQLTDEGCKTTRAYLLDHACDLMAKGESLGGYLKSLIIESVRETTRYPMNYKSVRRVGIALHTRDMIVRHKYGKHHDKNGAYYLMAEAYGVSSKTVERCYKEYGNF